MRFYLFLFILLILLAIAFIFGSQNDQMITLNYLIARTQMSVAMAVSLFTALGFLMGLIAVFMWKLSRVVKKKLPFIDKAAKQKIAS
ncbi:MAG: LapA family protein [Alteromonadaceae bacterium]|nr:LapA family protein [Alteromonadaceae bacterium]